MDLNVDKLKLLETKKEQAKMNSNIFSGLTGISEMFVGSINANILQGNFESLQTTADQIELQAEQRANMLREKFNQSIGDYKYTAVQRGFKTDSGSVKQNIEQSAIEVGKDIQQTKESAKIQADIKRRQAETQKSQSGLIQLTSLAKGLQYLGGIQ